MHGGNGILWDVSIHQSTRGRPSPDRHLNSFNLKLDSHSNSFNLSWNWTVTTRSLLHRRVQAILHLLKWRRKLKVGAFSSRMSIILCMIPDVCRGKKIRFSFLLQTVLKFANCKIENTTNPTPAPAQCITLHVFCKSSHIFNSSFNFIFTSSFNMPTKTRRYTILTDFDFTKTQLAVFGVILLLAVDSIK